LRGHRRLGAEGYRLRVGRVLEIAARTRAGAFYGGRTLLQLLRQQKPIRRGRALDWPRYPERGLMIDLGRRVYTARWIRREIRQLAYLKLNLFHWHLSDDQRWGIESDTHPEIVSEPHLTKPQVRRLVAFARRHHVTIVPEFDMPGHMGSILDQHPGLELQPVAGDPPPHPSTRKLDITNPAALRFVKSLIEEYLPLFPGPYWHVGADEYLSPAEFDRYPQLAAYARQRYGPDARTEDAILGFVNWVDRIVRKHGKTLRAWHDELGDGGAITVNPDVVVEWWINFSPLSDPRPPTPGELLAGGHRIMNAGWFPTYYTGDLGPVEGRPDMRKAYEEWAVNEFAGPTIAGQIIEKPYFISPAARRNLGSKINAWENTNLTLSQIAAGLEPRLAVIAQKTWNSPPLTGSYAGFERIRAAVGTAPGYRQR
jgi:hexosaminidase